MFCLAPGRAGLRVLALAFLAMAGTCCMAWPAQAQIASYVDGHGRLIYVNANPITRLTRRPAPRPQSAATLAPPAKLEKVADAAAKRNHLDPALVQAVIQTESGWNPYAVSSKGADGLMQLIPSTAERFGVANVFNPAENVEGGTEYLRELLNRYHGNLAKALAAYNAGEQAVARFGGVPAYPETQAYVRKVTNTYFQSDSGHSPTGEFHHHFPIREVTARNGRIVFTNE